MKPNEDEPEVVFDPELGRFVPPPKRGRAPAGCLVALVGAAGGAVLGALTGALLAPAGGGFLLSNAETWGLLGAILGFFTGSAVALLIWLTGRALRRRS